MCARALANVPCVEAASRVPEFAVKAYVRGPASGCAVKVTREGSGVFLGTPWPFPGFSEGGLLIGALWGVFFVGGILNWCFMDGLLF